MKDNLDEPKTCINCRKVYPRGDFPSAMARGRLVVRSWCRECLLAYYREVAKRRREKAKESVKR